MRIIRKTYSNKMAAPSTWHSNSMGRCSLPMLDTFPVALIVSAVLGFLAGLGVGGGSLLVLWLTLIVGMDHPHARIINLLFFIPTAVISSLFRWRQGSLNYQKVFPAVIAGCLAAALFSWLSQYLELQFLKKLFGFLLLMTGIREILYKEKSQNKC